MLRFKKNAGKGGPSNQSAKIDKATRVQNQCCSLAAIHLRETAAKFHKAGGLEKDKQQFTNVVYSDTHIGNKGA